MRLGRSPEGPGSSACTSRGGSSADGHEVRTLDLAPLDDARARRPVDELHGDVRDPATPRLVDGADVLVHAAAALPIQARARVVSVNVEARRPARRCGRGRRPRVVFISSTAVYGVPEGAPDRRGRPARRVGAYGESKIEAEQVCRDFAARPRVRSIVRPKTFIGHDLVPRAADRQRCGGVDEHVGAVDEATDRRRVADVAAELLHRSFELPVVERREVERAHGVAVPDQPPRQVQAEEPGSSGDGPEHAPTLAAVGRRCADRLRCSRCRPRGRLRVDEEGGDEEHGEADRRLAREAPARAALQHRRARGAARRRSGGSRPRRGRGRRV